MEAKALIEQGVQAQQQGKLAEAEQYFQKAVDAAPEMAEGWSKLGVICIMKGNRVEAMRLFELAMDKDPGFMPAYHNMALLLCEMSRFRDAEALCLKAKGRDPEYLPIYSSLALALKSQSRLSQAADVFREAIDLNPKDENLHSGLGAVLAELGRREEAAEAFEKTLAINPVNGEAHRMLSLCRKYEDGDKHIAVMEETLKKPGINEQVMTSLHFALGKAYGDCGQYDKSFRHFEKANALGRKSYKYETGITKSIFGNIKAGLTAAKIVELREGGIPDETPVFIIGMPRSGTSLTEQILASHPSVFGAGELNTVLVAQAEEGMSLDGYAQWAQRLTPQKVNQMAQKYLVHLRDFDMFASRITDKMPHNFQYAGLIHAMFPKARIVHCRREPAATCVSIFRSRFVGFMPFAYDLKEIGEYYKLYEDLMDHWRTAMPGMIHEVVYEDLVANPEKTVRGLLEYCGLPWDDACMSFHRNERPSMTASTLDIRKPLYDEAVDKWKNYEPFIAPLQEALK